MKLGIKKAGSILSPFVKRWKYKLYHNKKSFSSRAPGSRKISSFRLPDNIYRALTQGDVLINEETLYRWRLRGQAFVGECKLSSAIAPPWLRDISGVFIRLILKCSRTKRGVMMIDLELGNWKDFIEEMLRK
ncbi:hypothetical protein ETA_10770 [Erwinia tasmaniensis Et1/99]|uniref:Uncharacterized protein n=5 Tax=Erwinia TaxID=551 RepID=B2VE57_ERWT9|nr:hypothetical protein ETA_10770 [Erwinia tasmaniensis Et1/99]